MHYVCKNNDINFLQHIITQFSDTSFIEWLAVLFGIAQVVLAMKNKTLNFYAGIISVSLYIYLFYKSGLFAESLLNIYYLAISVAGIFMWQKKANNAPLPISKTSKQDWMKASALFLVLFFVLSFILKTYTTSNVPYADALVSALAWAGTWLMINRKLENWLVLNLSNAIAIPLLIYKGLELTALLTVIYFVVAVSGYFSWKKACQT